MKHLSKKEEAASLVQEMKDQIDNIRDEFSGVLENKLISEKVKDKIRLFLNQQSNDDMFDISDDINEDIQRILRENPSMAMSIL